ncbi:hypothetical protein ACET3Z_023718 [Daucus carota]|nr:PREDICTED: non-specific lipid-transfer protein 2B-like [Daucus carota subsp. sativus]
MGFSNMAVTVGFLLAMLIHRPALIQGLINCNQVKLSLNDCGEFVKLSKGPRASCCRALKRLNNTYRSTADRRDVCNCIKREVGSSSKVIYRNVALLPGKCGVRLGYTISPSIDCRKVT